MSVPKINLGIQANTRGELQGQWAPRLDQVTHTDRKVGGAGIDYVLGWDRAARSIQSKEWNTNSLAANLGDQHTRGHCQRPKELEGGNKAPEVTQVLASTPHTILDRSN